MILKGGVLHISIAAFKAIHWGVFFFNLQVNFSKLGKFHHRGLGLKNVPLTCVTGTFFVKPWTWFLNSCLEKQNPNQHLAFRQHELFSYTRQECKSCVVLNNASCLCCPSTVNAPLHSAAQGDLKDFGKYSVGRLFTRLSFGDIQRRSVPTYINACYANRSCEINRSAEIVSHWDSTHKVEFYSCFLS